jgi:hypothetical protein
MKEKSIANYAYLITQGIKIARIVAIMDENCIPGVATPFHVMRHIECYHPTNPWHSKFLLLLF